MKKFQGIRKLDELIKMAENEGWEVVMTDFDKGGDFICLRDMYGQNVKSNEGMPKQVLVNVTNGHFYVYEPFFDVAVATHASKGLDNERWYSAILNIVFEPLEGQLNENKI